MSVTSNPVSRPESLSLSFFDCRNKTEGSETNALTADDGARSARSTH
ncbi:hypothetical protein ACVWXN_006298 [Bradyrhizobium sp. i1.4.4]